MGSISGRMYCASQKLAGKLGIDHADILQVLHDGVDQYYRPYKDPKPNGGFRMINAVQEPLGNVQRAILKGVLKRIPVSKIAHGCADDTSIYTNAYPHWQSISMLGIDLKSAFDSTSLFKQFLSEKIKFQEKVTWSSDYAPLVSYTRFTPWQDLNLEKSLVEVVEALVDLKSPQGISYLPQGAPTSPHLFDLACRKMDAELLHLAENVGGVITRYIDNISFSWKKGYVSRSIYNAICRIIRDNGFTVNDEKTYFIKNGNRNGVPLRFPGVHIIDGNLVIPRKKRRHLRMALYCAGMAGKDHKANGYNGYVLQVMSEIPPQLQGVYIKAKNRRVLQPP